MARDEIEKRRRSRVVRVVIAVLVLLVAAGALGSWAAVRAWGPALARERVEAALTEALDRPVSVGRVALEPWLGRLVLERLVVPARPGEPVPHLLVLPRGEVRVGISSLWRRRVVVRRVVLEEPDVRLVAGEGAALAALPVLPERITAGPITIEVGAIEVRRGQVAYHDPAGSLRGEARDLRLTARPGPAGTTLEVALAALEVTRGEVQERLARVTGTARIRPDAIEVERLDAVWQDRPVRLEGRVSAPFDDPALDLRVRGEVDLAALARHAKAAWPVTGVARGRGQVTGRVTAPRAAVEVAVAALEAGPVRARDVAASLAFADGVLEVGRLDTVWEDRPVSLEGRVSAPFDDPALDLRVRGEVDLAALARHAKAAWPVRGAARVRGHVTGRVTAPRAAAEVGVAALGAGPVRARDVAASLAFADGVLTVSSATGQALDGAVAADLVLDLARPRDTRVGVRLRGVSVTALEALTGTGSGLTGRLDLDADATGDLRAPGRLSGRGRLAARDVRAPGRLAALGPATVAAEGRVDEAVLDLARGEVRWAALSVQAAGRATVDTVPGLHVRAAGDLGTLAPLAGGLDARGQATLEAELTGPWRDPALAGRLRIRSPAVAGVTLDEADVPFEASRRALRLAGASVALETSRLVASGTLAWPALDGFVAPEPGAVRLAIAARIDSARLEHLARWLPERLRGRGALTATADVDGSLAAWRVTGRAESPALGFPGVPPVRVVAAAFTATPERLEVRSLQAQALDIPVAASGQWRWAGAGEARAEVGPLSLARLTGVPEAARLEGQARGQGTVTLRAGHLAASARITAERLGVAGFVLGRGSADFTLQDSALRAEAALPDVRGSVTAEGRLDGAGAVAVKATLADVELAPIVERFLPRAQGALEGRLSLAAALDVPASDPRAARGTVRLEPVQLRTAGETWEARGPVILRREPGRVVVERLELAGRLGTVSGAGSVEDTGALDLRLRGEAPLALLAALRPEVREAEGRLGLDVRVGGTAASPTLVGRGQVTDGVLALRDAPVVLRAITGTFTLAPSRVRVDELRASIGSGTVRATGDVGLAGRAVGAWRLTLTAQRVAVTLTEGLDTTWDADLDLVGRGARGLVRGEARLVRGLYTRDLALLPLLLEPSGGDSAPEAGRQIGLQVTVRLDDNLQVRTAQAQFRAGGTLTLGGTVAAPAVLGTVETRDGRLAFRGHRFRLESATARFDDPRRLAPLLDVRATTRIRTYAITMWLSGRPHDLALRFASEPPLPQEDLLALVTLGATRAELGRSGGTAFAGEAAQLLVGELLGLEGGGTPTLDVIELERDEAGDTSFRVGKRVTERTLVIYSGSFAEGGKQKLRVEYELLGPLFLAGEQDFRGGFGADVVLRLRFR